MAQSLFIANYSRFMERFPHLALTISQHMSAVLPVAEEPIAPLSLGEASLLYVYGVGAGEFYDGVQKWLHAEAKRRLVFLEENPAAFTAFLHAHRAESILQDEQVLFDHPRNLEQLTQRFPVESIAIHCLPSRKGRVFQKIRLKLLRKTTLSYAVHIDHVYGYQHWENFLQNVAYIPGSFYANQLQGAFKDVPAILCGAGPSLQHAIETLRTLENRAILIAGGSTLAALSAQGIMPHFGMAVDPNLEEYRRLRNSFASEVPLLYSTRVHPKVFHTCNGPFGYMRSGIGGLPELWLEEELGLSETLIGSDLDSEALSVTTICLAWAHYMGCNPILFSGVDLAYVQNQQYAPGVTAFAYEPSIIEENAACDQIVRKKNGRGQPIATAIRWIMEANALSRFAKKKKKTAFFNTGDAGLVIPSVPYISLAEACSRLLHRTFPVRENIHAAITRASMPAHTSAVVSTRIEELRNSLERSISYLQILADEKKGSKALAELELTEEISYITLFSETARLLRKEHAQENDWQRLLHIALQYQSVFKKHCA